MVVHPVDARAIRGLCRAQVFAGQLDDAEATALALLDARAHPDLADVMMMKPTHESARLLLAEVQAAKSGAVVTQASVLVASAATSTMMRVLHRHWKSVGDITDSDGVAVHKTLLIPTHNLVAIFVRGHILLYDFVQEQAFHWIKMPDGINSVFTDMHTVILNDGSAALVALLSENTGGMQRIDEQGHFERDWPTSITWICWIGELEAGGRSSYHEAMYKVSQDEGKKLVDKSMRSLGG